jgi:hypothetical protein
VNQIRCTSPVGYVILADPVQQWRANYNYEVQRQNTLQGNAGVASANIKTVIRIENAIGSKNYNLAQSQLSSLVPSNNIEQNYKDVLSIMLALAYPIAREPNASEIVALSAIAEQSPGVAGPAVYSARETLFFFFNTTFKDEDYRASDEVRGVANIETPCCLTPASGTSLGFLDDEGNDLPIAEAVVQPDGSFAFDPFQLAYFSQQDPTMKYRIYAKSPSRFTVLDKDSLTLSDWIAASPLNLTLGGVNMDAMSLSSSPDTVIQQQTSVQDASGNTFTIGTTNSSNSDMLIQKHAPNGQLIWSKTFDGPTSGSDSAKSVTMDSHGSVYVAGKVWNGNHYDFQAIKYDSVGDMQWSSIIVDSAGRNNEPTGIAVNSNDETVCVTGTCISLSQIQYRTVIFTQCLSSSSTRLSQPLQEEMPQPILVEIFPNPSGGSLTVSLTDEGGSLELFDLNGKLIFSQQMLQSGSLELPENQVADGLYLLKFTTATGRSQFGKIVIQRAK